MWQAFHIDSSSAALSSGGSGAGRPGSSPSPQQQLHRSAPRSHWYETRNARQQQQQQQQQPHRMVTRAFLPAGTLPALRRADTVHQRALDRDLVRHSGRLSTTGGDARVDDSSGDGGRSAGSRPSSRSNPGQRRVILASSEMRAAVEGNIMAASRPAPSPALSSRPRSSASTPFSVSAAQALNRLGHESHEDGFGLDDLAMELETASRVQSVAQRGLANRARGAGGQDRGLS